MARRRRMYLPGYTYHIVQRGNNRSACFFEDADYRVYLKYLADGLQRHGNQLHAYCLMTNHVHFLITPERETGISSLFQLLCSRYGLYINKKYGRTGTLWEGRHKASAIDSNKYLLRCYRYIELNPVAAGMVDHPEDHQWSSYHSNALGEEDTLISEHENYKFLGKSRTEQVLRYRQIVNEARGKTEWRRLEQTLEQSFPLGSASFIAGMESNLGRQIGQAVAGRPRKA